MGTMSPSTGADRAGMVGSGGGDHPVGDPARPCHRHPEPQPEKTGAPSLVRVLATEARRGREVVVAIVHFVDSLRARARPRDRYDFLGLLTVIREVDADGLRDCRQSRFFIAMAREAARITVSPSGAEM
jgi:hypothetical protein